MSLTLLQIIELNERQQILTTSVMHHFVSTKKENLFTAIKRVILFIFSGDPFCTFFLQGAFFTVFAPTKKEKRALHGFQNAYAPKWLCWKLVSSVFILFPSDIWSTLIISIQISMFLRQNPTYPRSSLSGLFDTGQVK